MTLLAPQWLALLALTGAFVVAYVVLQRRRRRHAVRFANLGTLAAVAPRSPGWRRHLAAAALVLTMVALSLGLARPATSEEVARKEAIMVLAIDVSGSMTSTDVAPTRLQAAANAASDFIAHAPSGYQIGLVVFDDAAHVLATPTTDHSRAIAALKTLKRGPGTAAGDGIYAALDSIQSTAAKDSISTTGKTTPFATIVLLSDGASTIGRSAADAASAAKAQGVPVQTISFGTPNGTAIVDGKSQPVPADPSTMRQVAQLSGGSTFTASSGNQLRRVYDRIGTTVGHTTEQREYVLPLLAFATVTLLVAIAAGMLWSGRLV